MESSHCGTHKHTKKYGTEKRFQTHENISSQAVEKSSNTRRIWQLLWRFKFLFFDGFPFLERKRHWKLHPMSLNVIFFFLFIVNVHGVVFVSAFIDHIWKLDKAVSFFCDIKRNINENRTIYSQTNWLPSLKEASKIAHQFIWSQFFIEISLLWNWAWTQSTTQLIIIIKSHTQEREREKTNLPHRRIQHCW